MIWEDTSVANETRLYFYDGSQDILVAVVDTANDRVELAPQPLVDVASAATTDIGAVKSRNIRVTGATTITSFGTIRDGTTKTVYFAAALTVTYNATSLITPTGVSLAVAAGDSIDLVSLGSGNWRVLRHVQVAVVAGLQLIAEATPSTSAIDFTSLASTLKHIVVAFDEVTTGGSGTILIRLGTSGGFVSTGYTSDTTYSGSFTGQQDTVGFGLNVATASNTFKGFVHLYRVNSTDWICGGSLGLGSAGILHFNNGRLALGGTLTQLRVTSAAAFSFGGSKISIFGE
jgi:hypothetical protein